MIEVPVEYPVRPPNFKLSLLTKFEENSLLITQQMKDKSDPKALQLLAQGNNNVMDNNLKVCCSFMLLKRKNMEIEVNAKYEDLVANQPQEFILSLQLQKLRVNYHTKLIIRSALICLLMEYEIKTKFHNVCSVEKIVSLTTMKNKPLLYLLWSLIQFELSDTAICK